MAPHTVKICLEQLETIKETVGELICLERLEEAMVPHIVLTCLEQQEIIKETVGELICLELLEEAMGVLAGRICLAL
jgi:hypothetical protein